MGTINTKKNKKSIILSLVFDRLDRINTYCGENTLTPMIARSLQEFWEVTVDRKGGKVNSFNKHVAEGILDILADSVFEAECQADVNDLMAEIQDSLDRAARVASEKNTSPN